MRIVEIVHLEYEAPRDLPVCVHSLWHPYGIRRPGAVQIRTMGLPRCRLCHSVHHAVVNCDAHCRNRTPGVRGSTVPSSLRTHPMAAVWRPPSGSYTDPYSRCSGVQRFRLRQSVAMGWGTAMRVAGIVHLVYKAHGTSQFVYTACGSRMASALRELYRFVQRVYENAVGTIVFTMGSRTFLRVAGIIQLVYEGPRDLPVCVHSQWQPYFVRHQGAVQILSACVQKCRLRQSVRHGVVICHAHCWNRTPCLRGSTGPISLCT